MWKLVWKYYIQQPNLVFLKLTGNQNFKSSSRFCYPKLVKTLVPRQCLAIDEWKTFLSLVITALYNYFPITRMCHSRTFNNKISKIREIPLIKTYIKLQRTSRPGSVLHNEPKNYSIEVISELKLKKLQWLSNPLL